ncbi:MAG: glycosyltransferase family 9 protein [Candidatus Acidiferrales bacterium]
MDSQGLGDVVQSLPLLRAVCEWAKGRWPVQALFATSDHYEIVREEKLNLTPFFVSSVPRKPRSVLWLWSKLVGRPDLIVCAPEMSAAKLVWLKYATGARYAIGEASAPYDRFLTSSVETSWTMPWSETQDAIAAVLGIRTPLEPPFIRLTQQEIGWAESTFAQTEIDSTQRLLGIQCSSVVSQKCWPPANFGEVVKEMHRRYSGLCVVSFGNATERASADQARRIAGNVSWVEGEGQWSIRQTLAMLSRCDIFLSGDTGLMHMAAAVGTPTVSIFGPTSATRRAPTHNGGISVCPETPCHPCFQGAWTPCECIRAVTPIRVVAALDQCLAEIAESRSIRTPVGAETVGSAKR